MNPAERAILEEFLKLQEVPEASGAGPSEGIDPADHDRTSLLDYSNNNIISGSGNQDWPPASNEPTNLTPSSDFPNLDEWDISQWLPQQGPLPSWSTPETAVTPSWPFSIPMERINQPHPQPPIQMPSRASFMSTPGAQHTHSVLDTPSEPSGSGHSHGPSLYWHGAGHRGADFVFPASWNASNLQVPNYSYRQQAWPRYGASTSRAPLDPGAPTLLDRHFEESRTSAEGKNAHRSHRFQPYETLGAPYQQEGRPRYGASTSRTPYLGPGAPTIQGRRFEALTAPAGTEHAHLPLRFDPYETPRVSYGSTSVEVNLMEVHPYQPRVSLGSALHQQNAGLPVAGPSTLAGDFATQAPVVPGEKISKNMQKPRRTRQYRRKIVREIPTSANCRLPSMDDSESECNFLLDKDNAKSHLDRHKKYIGENGEPVCKWNTASGPCGAEITLQKDVVRHQGTHHRLFGWKCGNCGKTYSRIEDPRKREHEGKCKKEPSVS